MASRLPICFIEEQSGGRTKSQGVGEECAKFKEFKAIDDAYRIGDLNTLLDALGNPTVFPNCLHPWGAGLSDLPLEHAIYLEPSLFLFRPFLNMSADPNYPVRDGFPSLIAALSADREDRLDVVRLLLSFGADVQQRGVNDWTPLHYAVSLDDATAVRCCWPMEPTQTSGRGSMIAAHTAGRSGEIWSQTSLDAMKKSGSRRPRVDRRMLREPKRQPARAQDERRLVIGGGTA